MRSNNRRRQMPREAQRLEIAKLSHEGRGISHHEGKVVFVAGALPGETVLATFTGGKSSFMEAQASTIVVASPQRQVPPCPHFSTCGGCSLQHFAIAAQLQFKEEVLHERLEHLLGAASYAKLPALKGPDTGYRRKARLAVRHVSKKGKVMVGFRERHGSFITDMDSCAILDPRIGNLIPAFSALIGRMHSLQHIPQIEVAVGDEVPGQHSCALVFRHLQDLDAHDKDLLREFGREHAVDIYLQPKGPDSVHKIFPPGSPARLSYSLPEFNLQFAFYPLDFTQVNASINRQMLGKAIELLALEKTDTVLDLFCGLGNFTLPIATLAAHVTGVEGSQGMVERGMENAALNKLANVSFISSDLTLPPEQHSWLQQGFDKVLLDPPRSGALEVLPAILAAKPKRIVYVSCNPATLARDAALLDAHGYKLVVAGAMDMFPHTSHVEAIALFMPAGTRN